MMRKDNKGRALRKGEYQRSYDGKYAYGYVDALGRRRYIYSKDLKVLREREEKLNRDQMDGINVYVAGKANVNYLFDRYMSTKTNLRSSTYATYMYFYDHYVRETFGKKNIASVKYSDVYRFYLYLLNELNLSVSSVDQVHRLLYPSFELAVRDDIIRKNPCVGIMAEVRKGSKKKPNVRHALTIEQQRAFMKYAKENSPRWYGTELKIRQRLIENDLVEAILILPRNLFYTTDISVTLWILNKNKKARVVEQNGVEKRYRNRQGEILFMDLRQMGSPYEKKYIELTTDDRDKITKTYHNWQTEGYEETYENVPEFCYSASFEEVKEKGFTLVPSRYIEFINRDENIDFDTKMKTLQGELQELLIEEEKSKTDLLEVFKELGYEIKL